MDESKILQDELQQKINEEKEIAQQITELEKQKQDADINKKQDIINALEKEIQRKKEELYNIREEIRRIKKENESILERLRNEHIDVVVEEIKNKYNLSDDDALKIKNKLTEQGGDYLSIEKLRKLAIATYYFMNPEKIEKLEEMINLSSGAKEKIIEKNISASSNYEPTGTEGEYYSQEVLEISKKYKVDPKYVKKALEGDLKIEFFSKNSQSYE